MHYFSTVETGFRDCLIYVWLIYLNDSEVTFVTIKAK